LLTDLSSETFLPYDKGKCLNPGMGFPERLKKAMEAKGLKGADLARALKLQRQAVYNWLAGRADPTQENLRNLAINLDVDQEWLSTGRREKPGVVWGLELHGEVAGGVWVEVTENQDMEYKRVPVAPDPRYPTDTQYALQVRGNSINRIAKDGSVITCVDIIGAGLEIRDRDLVVVERRRGHLVETTVKRVRKGKDGLELWPESDDPSHQEKLTLGPRKGNTEVSIKALVIWTANPVRRDG
jgi:transcriptional regulator with XRE-family HTH domain